MQVNVNGMAHELDVDKALKLGVLMPPRHLGQLFKYEGTCEKFVLGYVHDQAGSRNGAVLLSLEDWCDFRSPVKVKHPDYITMEEWQEICGYEPEKFTQVFIKD